MLAVLVAAAVGLSMVVLSASPGGADRDEAPEAAGFSAISAGGLHSCALFVGGTVKCWGGNGYGQLGLGDTASRGDKPGETVESLPSVDLGTGRTAVAVSVGVDHTCAVLDDGSVKCWGANTYGQLGSGDTDSRGDEPGEMGDHLAVVDLGSGRTARSLSLDADHSCAVLDDASVKCWGSNNAGRLGLGDTVSRGDDPGEMGDQLPRVDLGSGRTAVTVSAGGAHTCALLDDATVKCWGWNSWGQLGIGGGSRGDGPGEMGDDLPAVDFGSGRTATVVSAGGGHTCAVLDEGTLKCWGRNDQGQLGVGDTLNKTTPGADTVVDLGAGRTATAVSAGDHHTCAVLDSGAFKCWGYNSAGQLGLNTVVGRGGAPQDMGDNLPVVGVLTDPGAITTGSSHTCALVGQTTVSCWGRNDRGQLGRGDTETWGDEAEEMGWGVSGTVRRQWHGPRLVGVWVALLRTRDFSLAAGGFTDAYGEFDVRAPAGTYYLYLIDPQGNYVAGFHGAPTPVTVNPGELVAVEAEMFATGARVMGSIADQENGSGLEQGWAVAVNPTTGAPEVANGGYGSFEFPNLAPGYHWLVFIDGSGAHLPEYYDNKPGPDTADAFLVNPGFTTNLSVKLDRATPPAGGATVSGRVTEQGTGTPLCGVRVIALRADTYRFTASATTLCNDGRYSLNLDPGSYKLALIEPSGRHDTEWHNNLPYHALASATSVTAPAVVNAALSPNTATLVGAIVDDTTTAPVAGAWVLAIGPNGVKGGAVTATDGTYEISGLAPGAYRAAFVDPNGGRTLEYHPDSPDYAGATPFNLTAGTTTTLDAALHHP